MVHFQKEESDNEEGIFSTRSHKPDSQVRGLLLSLYFDGVVDDVEKRTAAANEVFFGVTTASLLAA